MKRIQNNKNYTKKNFDITDFYIININYDEKNIKFYCIYVYIFAYHH